MIRVIYITQDEQSEESFLWYEEKNSVEWVILSLTFGYGVILKEIVSFEILAEHDNVN